jgi:hypothetical protein
MENKEYPYPDETTTNQLAKEADISAKQVKKWFANKRVRSQLCCKPVQRNRKKRRMPNGNTNEMAMMMMTSLADNKNLAKQQHQAFNQVASFPNHLGQNSLLKQSPSAFMNPFLMMNLLANQQQIKPSLPFNQNHQHLFNNNPSAQISNVFHQQQANMKCFPNASSITGQAFAQMMLYHLDQSKKAQKLNQQQYFDQQEEPRLKNMKNEETIGNTLKKNVAMGKNNNSSISNESMEDQTNIYKAKNLPSSLHTVENISESSEREDDEDDEEYMIEEDEEEVISKNKCREDEYYGENDDDEMNEDEGVHENEEEQEETNHASQTERSSSDESNENLTCKNKLLDKMMLFLSKRSESENKKTTSDYLQANSSSTSSAAESAISVNSYLNDYSSLCNIHYSSTTSPSSSVRFASSSSTSSSSSASSSSSSSGSSPLSNSSHSSSSSNNHSAKLSNSDLNSDDLNNYFQTCKTIKFPQTKNSVNPNNTNNINNNNSNNKQLEKKINFAIISTLID